MTVQAQNPHANPFHLQVTGAQLEPEYEVPVGAWTVQVSGSVVSEQRLLTIKPDQTQRLELAPRTGVIVALAVRAEDGDQQTWFRLRVVTPAGEQVAERVARLHQESRPIRVVVPPADSYRVLVEASDGRQGEAWFDRGAQWLGLRSGTPPPAPVEVVLR